MILDSVLVKEWRKKTTSPLSNMSWFSKFVASPNGEKILYLLAKLRSKDIKVRHFRVAEMKGFMSGRVYFIGICYIQYLILDFDSVDSV